MKHTAEWLRLELADIANDVASIRKSDLPEFSQGLDIICAYDTKVARILKELATLDLYEELKKADELICHLCKNCMEATLDCNSCDDRKLRLKVLAKVEGSHSRIPGSEGRMRMPNPETLDLLDKANKAIFDAEQAIRKEEKAEVNKSMYRMRIELQKVIGRYIANLHVCDM